MPDRRAVDSAWLGEVRAFLDRAFFAIPQEVHSSRQIVRRACGPFGVESRGATKPPMKTNANTLPSLPEPAEAEIQQVAHRLWRESGCPSGVETENWFAAKELLRHHLGRVHGPHQQPGRNSTVRASTVSKVRK